MTDLFLTQATISHAAAASRRIGDSYCWHKEIWRFFSDKPSRDFLTRVDRVDAGFRVWILSCTEPQQPDWIKHWQTKPVAQTFLDHSRYAFTLRANPTKKLVVRNEQNERTNGRRISIFSDEDLRTWMEQKAAQHGFTLERSEIVCSAPMREYFHKNNNQRGFHISVEFSGTLTVTDRERFCEAYQNGIGSAKSFGFGMLLLKPIR